MSTNFPNSLDSLVNPASSDSVATVDHAAQHANANDAIEALQAKVGADSSAVTSSHDYKLSEVTSTDKAVGKTATQTLTNKTLTSPTINAATVTGAISDSSTRTVTGSIDAGGATSLEIPNSATPTVDANGEIAIDTTVTDMSHGVMKYYSGEEVAVIGVPVAELGTLQNGDVVTYNSTADEFQLTQPGTVTVPGPSIVDINPIGPDSGSPRAVTTDEFAIVCHKDSNTGFAIVRDGVSLQRRNTTTEWADADEVVSIVLMDGYIYALLVDTGTTPDTFRVYRYLGSDVTSSPTQITFSGSNQLTTTDVNLKMFGDGTNIYITALAGNSANAYVLGKYTVSGTTFTYSSTITLASTPTFSFIGADTSGNFYIIDSSSYIVKYNSAGTNVYTPTTAISGSYDDGVWMYNDNFYTFNSTTKIWYKIPV